MYYANSTMQKMHSIKKWLIFDKIYLLHNIVVVKINIELYNYTYI